MIKKILNIWAHNQKLVAGILLAIALIFPLVFSHPYIINVAVIAGIFVVLSLSLNLITGNMGIVSLGHAAFFGIGAYTSAILSSRYGLSFIVTFIAATLLAGIFGLVLGGPTLRLTGRYLSIVTLAFCEIIRIIQINWISLTGGPLGITNIKSPKLFGFEFDEPVKQYYLILIICLFSIYIITGIINSKHGRAITAIKNDELAASSMGIVVYRYKLLVFVISSAIAGLAGAFYAHYIGFIDPNSFSFNQSIQILSMTIMGGLGNIYGSILGAIGLTIIPEILRPLLNLREVIYGALIVVMVLVQPKGILGGLNLDHIKQLNDYEKGVGR